MSAQELVACLCREGDQHLALGEPPLATAFYLAAFSCHAPSAVRSVRAALAEARGAPVVATLEAWCRGEGQIPAIHWDGMAVVSLTGTLACAFLATLCPDHPAAALHSLAGLLARGRHGEVVRRCGALLAAHSQQGLELRLTRALARILSGAQVDAGLADYLQAFASAADRTVAFVLTHQRPYLPVLVSILQAHVSGRQQATDSAGQQEADARRLLAALDPGGTWSNALSPEVLLRGGRYEDCRAACSRALEADPTGSRSQGRGAGHGPPPPRVGVKVAAAVSSPHSQVLPTLGGVVLRPGHCSDRWAGPCPYRAPRKEANRISALRNETCKVRLQPMIGEGFWEEVSFQPQPGFQVAEGERAWVPVPLSGARAAVRGRGQRESGGPEGCSRGHALLATKTFRFDPQASESHGRVLHCGSRCSGSHL